MKFLILFTAFTCAQVSLLLAADAPHAHSAMSGPEGSVRAEMGAQAAFDAQGNLWAVHKVSGHIAVSRSADQGLSWSNPVLVTKAPEPTDTGSDARPKIALGAAGEIYLTWTKPMTKPYTGEIRFARSLDGGRTFSEPAVVHRDRQEITHRFDTIAVNSKGQLFVAWIDKRDLKPDTKLGGAAVYFAVSDDRGATFRGDFKVTDSCCECCRIALVPRADGAVTAMWRHIFSPNIRDHGTATLFADGRASPVERASFEDWRIDACPHHGPAIAADASGQLHAVWFSAAPKSRGVFYGQLRKEGVNALRHVGSQQAGHADIAVNGQKVAVAWSEVADGRSRLRVMISRDGGATWTEKDLLTVAGAADYPRVLVHGDRLCVFWHTAERPLSLSAL